MSIDKYDYELARLEEGPPRGKGGNSSVFRALPVDDTGDELVVKFSNYPNDTTNRLRRRRNARFEREIKALRRAKEASLYPFIVRVFADGIQRLDGKELKKRFKYYKYYVMEKADRDLKQYIDNESLNLMSKLVLCRKIFADIDRLHQIGIYHRDIKPDNFLMFGNECKIGDLGLVTFKNEDSEIDRREHKIGPFGFLSPEAINRYWATSMSPTFGKLCEIDDKSDYFQIGLLFWYIFQAEVPIGQLSVDDLKAERFRHDIFDDVIVPLLQFNKQRRPTYNDVNDKLTTLTS